MIFLANHTPLNQRVPGSSPGAPTKLFNSLGILRASYSDKRSAAIFPDGRLEVRWKGKSLPYSAFDKLQRVSHAAIVENKRLGEILAWIKEQQDRQPRLNTIPKGPRRSSQASGLLKNRALRMAEAAKSKSKASPRGRRRSDMVVSAAPAHAPSEAAE